TLMAFVAPTGFVAALNFGESKPVNENPLEITGIEISPRELRPGGAAEVKVRFELAADHHAYLDQFKLDLESPPNIFLSEPNVTPVVEFRDPVTKKIKKGTEGAGQLVSVLQLPSNFVPGTQTLNMFLTYQAC